MTPEELRNAVQNLRELNRMAEELATEIEAIKDAIKDLMTTQNTDTLAGTDYKITYKEVKSNRFDTTAFKKAHSDLYEEFTKETTTKRFLLN